MSMYDYANETLGPSFKVLLFGLCWTKVRAGNYRCQVTEDRTWVVQKTPAGWLAGQDTNNTQRLKAWPTMREAREWCEELERRIPEGE